MINVLYSFERGSELEYKKTNQLQTIGHQPGSSGYKVEWEKKAENFTRFAKNSLFNFLLKTLQERQKYNSRSARLNRSVSGHGARWPRNLKFRVEEKLS